MFRFKIIKKLKIVWKLYFLFIVLTTIPVLIISSFIIRQLLINKKDEALKNVKNEVISIKERTNLILSRINRELIMFSRTSEIKQLTDYLNYNKEKKHDSLNNKIYLIDKQIAELFHSGLYFKIEILDENAQKCSSTYFDSSSIYQVPKNKLSKKRLNFYLDITSGMKNGDIKLSPSEVKMPLSGEITPSLDCIFPIFDSVNNLKLILIASIHARNFFTLFSTSNIDSNIKVVMTNGEGYYLYHSLRKNNWNRLLASRQEENLFHDYGNFIADSILNGSSGTIINNSDKIIQYTNIFELGKSNVNKYVIFTEIPKDIVFASVNRLLYILLIILVLILILSLVLAYYASRLFTKPIDTLIKGTQLIRNGELDYRIEIDTDDEIQDLANNFNELVVHWKEKRELEEKQRYEEDLKARKQYLENIIANMGHELRTPMIGIMGFSKIISKINDLEELHEIGDSIYDSSKRLMDTLNLIIDISKLISCEYDLHLTEVDLTEIVFMEIKSQSDFAKSKQIELNFNQWGDEMLIKTDLKAIQSIIHCLIDNAIKFTESGSVNIRISLKDDSFFIDINDTGIGIAEDKYDIIFQAFRQGSEGLSRSFEGTGLGLTLTKQYVELLNGNIQVKSKVGEGSTFTVILPKT